MSPDQLTVLRDLSSRYTSTMSARIRSLVTADNRALAARIIALLLTEEHGSSANSDDVMCIVSPMKEQISSTKTITTHTVR